MLGTIAENTCGKKQPLSPWLASKGMQSNSQNARTTSDRQTNNRSDKPPHGQ